jgi:diguanylate cyclase (GGDEF)-like protein
MQSTAGQRSRIPTIGRGLLALALVLCALFLAAAFLPGRKVPVAAGAAFVMLTATALLVSILVVPLPKAPWMARAAQHTLVALLLALGITILPAKAPLWLPLAVLVIFIASSETLVWTVTLGLGSGLLLAGATRPAEPIDFLADMLGLGGAGLAASVAFSRLKARTVELGRVITKMRQGADFVDTDMDPDKTFRGTVRRKEGLNLGKVSEEARTVRELDRLAHLTRTLAPFLQLARAMNGAHAALFFAIDHARGGAFLRAWDGPEDIFGDAVLPLNADPVAFVLDRQRTFYATDFRTLLWSLPYYKAQKRIGTLLAAPVLVRGAIHGLLVVDHEESQALANAEPVLKMLAVLISEVVENERETQAYAEREVVFEAAALASQKLAVITEVPEIHQFVSRAVKEMAPRTIGAGIVRLRGQTIEGMPGMSEQFAEWMGEGTKVSERTWLAWYLTGSAVPEPVRSDTPRDRGLPLFRPTGGVPGESLLVQPLLFQGRLVGALVAIGVAEAFDARVERVISLMANQAAAAIALIEYLEANRRLALHDGLTNLLNRRAFDDALERATSQANRASQPLSLLMLDLDHFKRLNDTYGHTVGDIALQAAANEIRLQVRGGDLAARYGGEEFAIILPDTDGPAAFRMAERLRQALADRVIKVGDENIRVTASCGVSALDLGYLTPEELLHSADEALYASKETGRNRTSLAGAPRK